jgi:hypothetical protein
VIKGFAILLLSVHFFSVAGYRLVFRYFEERTDRQLVQQLDRNAYHESQLMTVRIPLNLPYSTGTNEFERCDGSVELNGIYYNYVKRKVSNDTLILLCIPNEEKKLLNNAMDTYAKMAANTESSPSGKADMHSLLKSLFFEYNFQNTIYLFSELLIQKTRHEAANDNAVHASFVLSPEQPPEII